MNKNSKCKTMEELIEKAKHWVASVCGLQRKWLEAEPKWSYNSSEYLVRLCVLEGSPPRGYLIVDYASKTIKAFYGSFERTKTFKLEGF